MRIKEYISNNIYESIALGLIIFLALLIRVWGLAQYAFPADDACNLAIQSSSSYSDLWKYIIDEVHPPLGHFWGFFIRKFWDDPVYLRVMMSALPGLAAIAIYFQLGKRMIGIYAGFALSLAIAFSYADVYLSEVIRNYMWLLCFLGLALINLWKYLEEKNLNSRNLYFLFMFLAVFTNYSGAIPLLAMGILVPAWLFLEKKKIDSGLIKEIFNWAWPNILIAALITAFFLVQNPMREHARPDYCQNAFPSGFLSYMTALYQMISFQIVYDPGDLSHWDKSQEIFAILSATAIAGGFIYLLYRKQWKILAFAGLPIAINILLAIFKIYPVSSCRHTLFNLPFFLIPLAYTVQQILRPNQEMKKTGLIIISFLAVLWSVYIAEHNFYRFWIELPKTASSEEEARQYLKAHKAPNDIVITDGLQAFTFEYKAGVSKSIQLDSKLWKTNYQGMDIYFDSSKAWPVWFSKMEVREFFLQLEKKVDLQNTGKIWFIKFGPLWQTPIAKASGEFAPLDLEVIDRFQKEGSVVYSVKASDWLKFIKEGS